MKKVKILIIRFRRVGDAILTQALCKNIKESIPNAEIHYVLYDFIGELFTADPNIDKVITFNKKERASFWTYIKKVFRIMTQNKYDIIIDVRSTLNTLPFALFSPFSKYRIGQKKWYNLLIHNYRIDTDWTINYIDQNSTLLNPLKKEYDIKINKKFAIYIKEEEKLSFRKKMEAKGIDFTRPVVVLTVTTRVESKRCPITIMIDCLIRIMTDYPTYQLIFNFGDEEEKAMCQRIYNELNKPEQVFIDIEADNLRELAAMLSNCDFLFGNEGGPRHLSEALGVPSLAYFSPKISHYQWLPDPTSKKYQAISIHEYDIPNKDKLTYSEQLNAVTADMIWKQLQPRLEEIKR